MRICVEWFEGNSAGGFSYDNGLIVAKVLRCVVIKGRQFIVALGLFFGNYRRQVQIKHNGAVG